MRLQIFVGYEIGMVVKVSSCMYLPANHRSYMQNNPIGKHGLVLRLLRASVPPLSCKEDQAQSYIRIEFMYFKAGQTQNPLMKSPNTIRLPHGIFHFETLGLTSSQPCINNVEMTKIKHVGRTRSSPRSYNHSYIILNLLEGRRGEGRVRRAGRGGGG